MAGKTLTHPGDEPDDERDDEQDDEARYESTITVLERARGGDEHATLVLLERTVAPCLAGTSAAAVEAPRV